MSADDATGPHRDLASVEGEVPGGKLLNLVVEAVQSQLALVAN